MGELLNALRKEVGISTTGKKAGFKAPDKLTAREREEISMRNIGRNTAQRMTQRKKSEWERAGEQTRFNEAYDAIQQGLFATVRKEEPSPSLTIQALKASGEVNKTAAQMGAAKWEALEKGDESAAWRHDNVLIPQMQEQIKDYGQAMDVLDLYNNMARSPITEEVLQSARDKVGEAQMAALEGQSAPMFDYGGEAAKKNAELQAAVDTAEKNLEALENRQAEQEAWKKAGQGPLYGMEVDIQNTALAINQTQKEIDELWRDYEATGNEESYSVCMALEQVLTVQKEMLRKKQAEYSLAGEQVAAIGVSAQHRIYRSEEEIQEDWDAAKDELRIAQQKLDASGLVGTAPRITDASQVSTAELQTLLNARDAAQRKVDLFEKEMGEWYERNRQQEIQAMEMDPAVTATATAGKRRDRLIAEAILDPSAENVAKLYTTFSTQDEILGIFYMTEEEKAVVKAYADAGDYAAVGEYIDLKTRDLNARRVQHYQSYLYEFSEEHPGAAVLIHAGAALFNIGGWLESGRQTIKNTITGKYEPIDPNTWAFGAAQTRAVTSESLLDDIETPGGRFLAQTALSMIDFMVMAPTGVMALPLMGANAAGDTAYELAQQGVAPGKVFAMATITGLIEIATEKLPLDKLKELFKNGGTSFLINGVKQMLPEAGEEIISEYAGLIAERFILRDDSEMEQYTRALMAEGVAPGKAERMAATEFCLVRPALAGLGGGLSGFAMGSVGSAIGSVVGSVRSERIMEQWENTRHHPLEVRVKEYNSVLRSWGLKGIVVDGELSGQTAYVNTRTGEIHISPEMDPQAALSYKIKHELGHLAAKGDGSLVQDTMQLMRDMKIDVDAQIAAKRQLYAQEIQGMSEAKAREYLEQEVFGDFIAQLNRDVDMLEWMAKEKPNVFQRILEAIENFVRKLLGDGVPEMQTQEYQAIAQRMREIIGQETGHDMGQVNKTAAVEDGGGMGGELRFSKESIDKLTEQDVHGLLENAVNGVYAHGSYIPLRRNTPSILISVVREHSKGSMQVQNLPIVMQVGKAMNAMGEDVGSGKNRSHGISPEGMIEIIKGMDHPDYIVLQENGRYVEIIRFYDGNVKNAWAVLDFGDFKGSDLLNGYEGGNFNVLVTTFTPDDMKSYMNNKVVAIAYDKKMGTSSSGSGSQLPSHTDVPKGETSPFANIIEHEQTAVKQSKGEIPDIESDMFSEVGPAKDGNAEVLMEYGEEQTTASLGIPGGSRTDSIRLVTAGETISSNMAGELAFENDLHLQLFGGGNLHIGGRAVQAYINDGIAYVRVDAPNKTAAQLMRELLAPLQAAQEEAQPSGMPLEPDDLFNKQEIDAINAELQAEQLGEIKALPEREERMQEMGAADSTYGQSARDVHTGKPGTPTQIGTVDFANQQEIAAQMDAAQKETEDLDYEVNYTVTTDGKVWRVSGEEGFVNSSAIPSSLAGSYSFHNHPEKKTWFSFSAVDVRFFFKSGAQYAKAADYMYEYTMERTKNTVEVDPDVAYHRFEEILKTHVYSLAIAGKIDVDRDGYHETMKRLSKEYGFVYERRARNSG